MKATAFFSSILFFIAVIIQIIFFYLNPFRFEIWDQITFGISSSDSINLDLEYFDAHTIRVIIINFVILVGNFFSYSPDFSFNIFLNILVLGEVYLILKIFSNFRKNLFELFAISLSPLLICHFQNGRGVITSFAFLLLYFSLVKFTKHSQDFFKFFGLFIMSILLLNVSSGSFMVGIISSIAFLYRALSNQNKYKMEVNKMTLFSLILIFILISPLVMVYLSKNLEFYDGSIILMLNHGILAILGSINYIMLPMFILVIFPIFFLIKLSFSRFRDLNSFQPFLFAGIFGLLFGFTAFFTGIYLYLIFACILFNNLISEKKSRIKLNNLNPL